MKDAKGHGSDPRGAHAAGTDAVGKTPLTLPDVTERPTDPFIGIVAERAVSE